MSETAQQPLISFCIPTHHGRCEALRELVEGVIQQAAESPGLAEVCVSDNASSDGTAEMLQRLARTAPCRLAYYRQQRDRGLAPNLLKAVELALGRYCWLLGSDDLLAPRALQRAGRLLEQLPNATGYVVGAVHVDAADPRLRSRALPRAFHPPGQRPRPIEGVDRIYDQCGNAWCALSWSIVSREAWTRAARRQAAVLSKHPVFPQVVVLAAMAAERPRWGWLAEPLVLQRNATTFLFERGAITAADRWARIVAAAADVWAFVLGGRGGAAWRRRMRRLHRVWGKAADVRASKLYQRPPLRSQTRLALALLGAFWPSRDYWRQVLAASLMPTWMTRLRYGYGRQPRPRLAPDDVVRLAISGAVPARLPAGSVTEVRLKLSNGGSRTVLPDGDRAVTIEQQWLTAGGRVLGRDELGLNELAAFGQSLPCAIRAGRAAAIDLVLYAPLAPGAYGLRLIASQHGREWLGASRGALSASVEVVEANPPQPSRDWAPPGGAATPAQRCVP